MLKEKEKKKEEGQRFEGRKENDMLTEKEK